MSNLISIIVPIYNSEAYISRFIKNLSKQTYDNFELIFVIDGSTDNSNILIEKYLKKEKIKKNTQILYTSHKGVSHARNVGLKFSKGEIIGFCDVDDVMNRNMLSTINNTFMQYKCDIVYTYAKKINTNEIREFVMEKDHANSIKKISKNKFLNEISFNDKVYGSVWNKYFSRKIIHENEFNENLSLCEDFNFLYRLVMQQSDKLKIIKYPVMLYGYVNNTKSITHNIEKLYAGNTLKYNQAIEPLCNYVGVNKIQRKKLLSQIFELNSDALFGKQYNTLSQKKVLIKKCKNNYINYIIFSHYKFTHKIKKCIKFLPYVLNFIN